MINFSYTHPKNFVSNYTYLVYLTIKGAVERKCSSEQVPNALPIIKRELKAIQSNHLVDYFLIWYDLMRYCKEQHFALFPKTKNNSSVCYCLGLTEENPVTQGVPHEVYWQMHIGVRPQNYDQIKAYVQSHFADDSLEVDLGQLGIEKTKVTMSFEGHNKCYTIEPL